MQRTTLITSCLVASSLLCAASAQVQGPSSSRAPYILPVAPLVQTVSILTVGDTVGGYRLVGLPDGLGARALPGGKLELLVDHELGASVGAVRAHGQVGSFVSKWEIDSATLAVHAGADLIQSVQHISGGPALGRLCSADLPARKAFFQNTPAAPFVFMSGEEVGAEGRAFAHVVTGPEAGTSFELSALGKSSWENLLARPFANRRTVVIGLDDSTPGQVYVYVGDKRRFGTTAERAGLVGGALYGVRVPGVALEDRASALGGATTFELAPLGDVSSKSGAQLQAESTAAGVTEFLRPEDGVWDPADPRDFYFVTTDRFDTPASPGRSRLWRLRFQALGQPELGGTIEMLLDGTEGQQMFDNLTIDRRGHLLIQEDPGNQAHLARIWQYTIASDSLTLIAQHDASLFVAGGAGFLTQDEESSGIVDASALLGPGWFLLDSQAHYAIPGELVEGGQLLALFNPDSL